MTAATHHSPPRCCPGCGRYTAIMDGFYCPRCAHLADWLRNPKKYPPLKTDPEKGNAYKPL